MAYLDTEFRAMHARTIYEDTYVNNNMSLTARPKREIDLSFVLEIFAQGECRDPRDIFYSIRSMVENPHHLPQLQYNLSPEIVFRQHIEYLLACGAGASMLQHGGLISGPQKINLPSWCPAWTPVDHSALPRRYFVDLNERKTIFSESDPVSVRFYQDRYSALRAGGELSTPYKYCVDDGSLSFQGIVVGNVLETQPQTPYAYSTILPNPATGKSFLTYDLRKDRELVRRCSSRHVLPPEYQFYLDQDEIKTGEAKGYDIFLHTRHGALDFWLTSMYMSDERLSKKFMHNDWVQQMNELLPKRMLCAINPEQESVSPHLSCGDAPDGSVQLAGLPIGFVPYDTKKGDLVVVLGGVASPMVIRKFERSQPEPADQDHFDPHSNVETWTYQVVGEAYFTQYSDGQVVQHESLCWKQFKLV